MVHYFIHTGPSQCYQIVYQTSSNCSRTALLTRNAKKQLLSPYVAFPHLYSHCLCEFHTPMMSALFDSCQSRTVSCVAQSCGTFSCQPMSVTLSYCRMPHVKRQPRTSNDSPLSAVNLQSSQQWCQTVTCSRL